jgi:acetoacetyl-CoA synthetase
MKECPSFKGVIVVQRFDNAQDTSHIPNTQRLEAFLSSASSTPPPIEKVDFQDPMIVYYSSGTTGTPKAIVHGVGPILVSMGKEAVLHRELTYKDVALQYTTTGWIMYLASVSRLAFGGRTVFYDGSPFVPDRTVLLRIVEEQKVTNLGISPRWLGELMKEGIVPQKEANLSSLTAVLSTGMVLKEQVFEWFYDGAFPNHIKLANFSGGTDIVSLLLRFCIYTANIISSGRLLRHGESSMSHLRWWMSWKSHRHSYGRLPILSRPNEANLPSPRRRTRRFSRNSSFPKRPSLSLE